MKLALVIVILANIIACGCNITMTYANFVVATHIESLSADIRDSWQKNDAAYQRLGVALGQIERDLIRIRAKTQRGQK